ncbi:Uncharacterised protein [Burkholderia pseudomallei]|nr:Uncharacterised protein [Burkholderia pseudomallei]CAJ3308635.1 Uncharacterised protein [Burkholderia pseudomallei]CAJ3324537.1 Uncharacterised protein [Burkholderia pseudomallei]CAJ6263995.1 Uncharacterised protein [Burkholderia pseudomallei]CAJ6306607.1 Uncharacterised protein [Burkholderia pseudomallei]
MIRNARSRRPGCESAPPKRTCRSRASAVRCFGCAPACRSPPRRPDTLARSRARARRTSRGRSYIRSPRRSAQADRTSRARSSDSPGRRETTRGVRPPRSSATKATAAEATKICPARTARRARNGTTRHTCGRRRANRNRRASARCAPCPRSHGGYRDRRSSGRSSTRSDRPQPDDGSDTSSTCETGSRVRCGNRTAVRRARTPYRTPFACIATRCRAGARSRKNRYARSPAPRRTGHAAAPNRLRSPASRAGNRSH